MAFSKAPRYPHVRKEATPGPGAYSPVLPISAPSWSFAPRMQRKPRTKAALLRVEMEPTLPHVEMSEVKICGQLGRGGVSTVLLGQWGERTWAVKVPYRPKGVYMLTSLEDDQRALEREALLLHKLRHSNIVEACLAIAVWSQTSSFLGFKKITAM